MAMRSRWAVLCLGLFVSLASAGAPGAQEGSIQVLEPPAAGSGSELDTPEAAEEPAPPPCGTQPISIARMQWPSSEILAVIHTRLLTEQYGCDVRVQQTDMAAAGSSMGASGQPAVVPELWTARIPEIWNAAVKSQKVRQAGNTYAENGLEGWFVPDYALERWPDIGTIDGLKAHALEFSGGGARARFISCPPDWACAVINRNLMQALGLGRQFEIVEPANRFELDTVLAEAVSRKEPILFYYWQPNAILAQFGFSPIELGPYVPEAFTCLGRIACALPQATSFAPDPVIIAVAEWVFIDAPQVASYFGRARMPIKEMNAMLQALSVGGTPEDVAASFIATREEVWRPWLGQPTASAKGP